MNGRAKTLDERYFNWLGRLVGMVSNRQPEQSHILLSEHLFKKAFQDWLPNDDNRARDGIDLRYEFMDETGTGADREWLEIDCSIFEMLVALARRMSDHTDWTSSQCYWLLITNLELEKYSDDHYNSAFGDAIDFVLDTLNDRTYERDGRGGLFPLEDAPTDQREVEIWYQMSAYLLENFAY